MLCAECGFDWTQPPTTAIDIVANAPSQIAAVLDHHTALVRFRPSPSTWSMLEYAAHLSDAVDWYADRLERIHAQENAQLEPFDWDTACEQRGYNGRAPEDVIANVVVSSQRCVAALRVAAALDWTETGVGSDGTPRSTASQARRAAHQVIHHLHDVNDVARRVGGGDRPGGASGG